MPMSASVVCNNILTRAFQENIPVSPMKLQKLMYFVSCEYVKATGKDLLSENFGVWQYGPVLPSLYDEFKSFHDQPITKYATDADGVPYAINEDTAPHLTASITRVWNAFKGMEESHCPKSPTETAPPGLPHLISGAPPFLLMT